MPPKTIDSIPSELLLLMFDKLSSLEKVQSLSICKRWLEVFDEYQVLWRRLDLPQRSLDYAGWPSSALDLFDRKSASTLRVIKMDVNHEPEAVEHFLQILSKQKDTLRVLHLRAHYRVESETISKILSNSKGLLDCRFTRISSRDASKVRLLTHGIEREDESTCYKGGLKLKILWNPSPEVIRLKVYLLRNLVSFKSAENLPTGILWTLLEECSQNLKHLSVPITRKSENSMLTIELPRLQVFETYCELDEIPAWMKMPLSVTLVCVLHLPSLPSVSKIWLHDLMLDTNSHRELAVLAIRCPEVIEIIVESSLDQGESGDLTSTECQLYVAMLRQRKQNVAARMEVDDIRMINLKRLVVPFTNLTDEDLFDLRELVEEVVDLNTVQRFIEVQI